MPDYTRWLNAPPASRDGKVFNELYAELQNIARGRLATERPGQTLNATALVHEAWLRLENAAPQEWQNRRHFYGAAAEAMRRILVEAARRRLATKRGEGEGAVPLDEALAVTAPTTDERLLGIHEVLGQLEQEYELEAQIVKLRFFGGMKHEEIAALLGVSVKAVQRHWAHAKVWLYRAMKA